MLKSIDFCDPMVTVSVSRFRGKCESSPLFLLFCHHQGTETCFNIFIIVTLIEVYKYVAYIGLTTPYIQYLYHTLIILCKYF